ncbi:MAG: sodium-dependent transporter [Planctomycetota bacterium]|jgi:NSS family neurotransmitter:Na+ symporter
MAELLEEQRESWGTRGGFILAAVGSAVGLGNLWGFPYKLYSYGGGAFLIPYILALFVIGVPIMILEFSIGHYTQRAAPDAFKRGHKRFEIVGWWGILLAFVIVTYYPVILAYCFSFLWYSIVGIFNGGELPWAGTGIEGVKNAKAFFNEKYLGKVDITDARHYLGSIRWNIVVPLAVTWTVMYLCIFKGVKLVGKIVWLTVPLPWLMLLILTIRGLTLEGSIKGLAFYLDPVWSELAKPVTWRFAFGQVFFSLSLAYGIMITYASFLHRKSDINNNAAIISVADFGTSFIAGLAVFATLGGMAFVTEQAGHAVPVKEVAEAGPSLAFVAFPYALAQLPYSAWFSFVFFFALVTLGVDSAFSMTEAIVASIVDKTGWRRSIVLPALTLIGFCLGLLYVTEGGFNWLGTIDTFVNGTWGITFLGLLECIVIGWLWRVGILRRHANSRSDWKVGKWWDYLIRMVIPVVLGALFFWQLFDDIGKKAGFLKRPDGWLCATTSDHQDDLDKGVISDDLREEFLESERSLSQGASVSVEKAGEFWTITDGARRYAIRSEDKGLNIYLFLGVDAGFQDDLGKGLVSDDLRAEFVKSEIPLSEGVEVSVKKEGQNWLITDSDGMKYSARAEAGGLNIYAVGKWMLPNCVGLVIVALVPVFAVILSFIKGREDIGEAQRPEQGLAVKGATEGRIALAMTIVVAGLLVTCLKVPMADGVKQVILWISLVGGIAAMLLSNYVLGKYHTTTSQAAWSARWAGIAGSMGAGAAIAMMLIGLTSEAKEAEELVRDKLSGTSYLILGVVFLIIIGGLAWSFYKALAATKDEAIQHADEQ